MPLGFRLPAEWESHRATWLSWPYNVETWGDHLEGAEEAFSHFIEALLPHEQVELCMASASVELRARKSLGLLAEHPSLRMHRIETGDIWFRDFGPLFVVRGEGQKREVACTNWIYNALGNKYADLLIGNDVPSAMPLGSMERFDIPMVLEGGSIDVNGTGSLLTTESCLLSPDRNPSLTKQQIEQNLRRYLGVTNILWLKAGIEGDDTTGHVDDITRFVGPRTVVTVIENDPEDENYAVLNENAHRLKEMKAEDGQPLTVTLLPMPEPIYVDDRRMAASYANFYIANGAVIVPTYAQPSDREALSIVKQCFPEREVIGIDCRELIFGYGALHCSSMQEPAPNG